MLPSAHPRRLSGLPGVALRLCGVRHHGQRLRVLGARQTDVHVPGLRRVPLGKLARGVARVQTPDVGVHARPRGIPGRSRAVPGGVAAVGTRGDVIETERGAARDARRRVRQGGVPPRRGTAARIGGGRAGSRSATTHTANPSRPRRENRQRRRRRPDRGGGRRGTEVSRVFRRRGRRRRPRGWVSRPVERVVVPRRVRRERSRAVHAHVDPKERLVDVSAVSGALDLAGARRCCRRVRERRRCPPRGGTPRGISRGHDHEPRGGRRTSIFARIRREPRRVATSGSTTFSPAAPSSGGRGRRSGGGRRARGAGEETRAEERFRRVGFEDEEMILRRFGSSLGGADAADATGRDARGYVISFSFVLASSSAVGGVRRSSSARARSCCRNRPSTAVPRCPCTFPSRA